VEVAGALLLVVDPGRLSRNHDRERDARGRNVCCRGGTRHAARICWGRLCAGVVSRADTGVFIKPDTAICRLARIVGGAAQIRAWREGDIKAAPVNGTGEKDDAQSLKPTCPKRLHELAANFTSVCRGQGEHRSCPRGPICVSSSRSTCQFKTIQTRDASQPRPPPLPPPLRLRVAPLLMLHRLRRGGCLGARASGLWLDPLKMASERALPCRRGGRFPGVGPQERPA
jgi:hypothetical protein